MVHQAPDHHDDDDYADDHHDLDDKLANSGNKFHHDHDEAFYNM